ncbi:MAG: DUF3299 domain-containing protein [Bacteroidota bacterium]
MLILCKSPLQAQANITWDLLGDVTFESSYSPEYGVSILTATFGRWIKAFEQKEVYISGYVIPLDPMGISYALSRNPNSSCFFCGGSGPETVLGLNMKPGSLKKYEIDQIKTFKGTLKMNITDEKEFIYVLENAVEM